MKLHEVSTPSSPLKNAVVQKLEKYINFLDTNDIEVEKLEQGKYRVNYKGSVSLGRKNLTRLPVDFGKVEGFFNCGNNQLTSLSSLPYHVESSLHLANNKFQSYHNIHKYVKYVGATIGVNVLPNMLGLTMIKGVKSIVTEGDKNKLGELMSQYIGDPLACQEAMIEAGYVEQARV